MNEVIMGEKIFTIVTLLLGWLVGLLSPGIIKYISSHREKKALEKVVFNDLKDLKKRLGPLPFLVLPRYGKLDKESFDWIKKNSGLDFQEILKGHNEEDAIKYLNIKSQEEEKLTYFKKMNLFVIDSNLMNINLLDDNLISQVLEVKFYINALNEDIDNFREHLKMTFLPGISTNNHKIISNGLDIKTLEISEKSIIIVDKISTILQN